MARSGNFGCLFVWFIVLSITLGTFVLMPILLVLYTSPSSPSFSINVFDNQTLNMTRADDSPKNLTIHFDLKLKNENVATGLHYPDPLTITFSYFPNVSFLVMLAEYKLESFYQGNGKTRHVRDMVETNIFPTVLEGTDMIAFRVDLAGTFRYKKAGTQRHKVELGCLVSVNYTTSNKMQTGSIGLVQAGQDSMLKPKPPPVDTPAQPFTPAEVSRLTRSPG